MIKVILRRRSHDYHASLEGQPEVWGCGRSVYEAIGNLVSAHSSALGIKVESVGDSQSPD